MDPSAIQLTATGQFDGSAFSIACDPRELPNAAEYWAGELYSVVCVSTDDEIEIGFDLDHPDVRAFTFDAEGRGVFVGAHLTKLRVHAGSPDAIDNSITITKIDPGKRLQGSFKASWGAPPSPASQVEGAFDLTFF